MTVTKYCACCAVQWQRAHKLHGSMMGVMAPFHRCSLITIHVVQARLQDSGGGWDGPPGGQTCCRL